MAACRGDLARQPLRLLGEASTCASACLTPTSAQHIGRPTFFMRLRALGSRLKCTSQPSLRLSVAHKQLSLLLTCFVRQQRTLTACTSQMLRRYSRKAMALHLQHFGLVQKGAESHSVLVTVSLQMEGRPQTSLHVPRHQACTILSC